MSLLLGTSVLAACLGISQAVADTEIPGLASDDFRLLATTTTNSTITSTTNRTGIHVGVTLGLFGAFIVAVVALVAWFRFLRKKIEKTVKQRNTGGHKKVEKTMCEHLMEKKGAKQDEVVPDYKFSEIDMTRVPNQSNTFFWFARFKSASRLFTLLMDLLVVNQAFRTEGGQDVGIAYAVFLFIGLMIMMVDIAKASYIIESDDISDSYTNLEAFNYWTIRSKEHYNLFSIIGEHSQCMDKMSTELLSGLNSSLRLFLSELPLFLLSIVLVAEDDQSEAASVLLVFKVLVMTLRLFTAGVILCMFPLFKLSLRCGNVTEYTSWRMEVLLHQTVVALNLKKGSPLRPAPVAPAPAYQHTAGTNGLNRGHDGKVRTAPGPQHHHHGQPHGMKKIAGGYAGKGSSMPEYDIEAGEGGQMALPPPENDDEGVGSGAPAPVELQPEEQEEEKEMRAAAHAPEKVDEEEDEEQGKGSGAPEPEVQIQVQADDDATAADEGGKGEGK